MPDHSADDDDKPTTHVQRAAPRKPRDAYGDPDGVTRKMPAGGATADEATAYVGRKRAGKAAEGEVGGGEIVAAPVVAWLVVVGGPGKGRSVELHEGRNLVGRGEECEVRLDFGDATISRDYSFVVRYTPSTRRFKIAPNIAVKNAALLNGEEFDETVDLHGGDLIGVGATNVRFVPLCGDDFDWGGLEAKPG